MDNIKVIYEDFNRCELKISLLLEINNILKILDTLKRKIPKDRDSVKIEIYGEYESIDEITESTLKADTKLLDEEDEKCITIKISKSVKNFCLSVYSLKKFTESLKNRTLEDLLYNFSENSRDKQIVFNLIYDKLEFWSRKYIFSTTSNNKDTFFYNGNEKNKIFERNELCNINSNKKIDLLPYDFYLLQRTDQNLEIEKIFDKLTLLLSVIAISNYSSFKKNKLDYSINGYNNIKSEINFEHISFPVSDIKKIYDIFDWIYKEEKNILERIEVSRNILSLYCIDNNILEINNSILNSIKSNYSIYLKRNVDRYMKVIKDGQSLLNELENNFYMLQNTFNNKFKKSISTLFTFLISTVLFNTLATGKIQNIFTKDITILSIVLFIILIIVFLYEIFELIKNTDKIENNYEEKKKLLYLILGKNEIEVIFKDIKILELNKKEVKNLIKKSAMIFIILLIIFFTALFYLSIWFKYFIIYKAINFCK